MTQTTQTMENKTQNQTDHQPIAQAVEFSEAPQNATKKSGNSLNMLLDMEVSITVNLGHAQLPIKHLLEMGPDSVVKLDKKVDTPVDLYLKESKFATGTIVVVDDKFAVKINQLFGIDPIENNK